MTDRLMIELRRSPRKLLERDGHPGPGPGHLALIFARAGVGKTAFLVGIGVDALLAGQKVLHVSLESTVDTRCSLRQGSQPEQKADGAASQVH